MERRFLSRGEQIDGLTSVQQRLLFREGETDVYAAATAGILRVLLDKAEENGVVLGRGILVEDNKLTKAGRDFSGDLLQHLIGYSRDYGSLQIRIAKLRERQKELPEGSEERREMNEVLSSVEMRLRSLEAEEIQEGLISSESGGERADKINAVIRDLSQKQGVSESFVRKQLAMSLVAKRRKIWRKLSFGSGEANEYSWEQVNEALVIYEQSILSRVDGIRAVESVKDLTDLIYWKDEVPVVAPIFLQREALAVLAEVLQREGIQELADLSRLVNEAGLLIEDGKGFADKLFGVLVARFITKDHIEIALGGLREQQKSLPAGSQEKMALHLILSSVQTRLFNWEETKRDISQILRTKVDSVREKLSRMNVSSSEGDAAVREVVQGVLAVLEEEDGPVMDVQVEELARVVGRERPGVERKMKIALATMIAISGIVSVIGLLGLEGSGRNVSAAEIHEYESRIQRMGFEYVPGNMEMEVTRREVWQEQELPSLSPKEKLCLEPVQVGQDGGGNPVFVWKYIGGEDVPDYCGERFPGLEFSRTAEEYEKVVYNPLGADGEIAAKIHPELQEWFTFQNVGPNCRITTLSSVFAQLSEKKLHPWVLSEILREGRIIDEVEDFSSFVGKGMGGEPRFFLASELGIAVEQFDLTSILGERFGISDDERKEDLAAMTAQRLDGIDFVEAILPQWELIETEDDADQKGRELVAGINDILDEGGIPTVEMYVSYIEESLKAYRSADTPMERRWAMREMVSIGSIRSLTGHSMAVIGAFTDPETGKSYLVASEPNGGYADWKVLEGREKWGSDGYAVVIPLDKYNMRLFMHKNISVYSRVTEEYLAALEDETLEINFTFEPGRLIPPVPSIEQSNPIGPSTVKIDPLAFRGHSPRLAQDRQDFRTQGRFQQTS